LRLRVGGKCDMAAALTHQGGDHVDVRKPPGQDPRYLTRVARVHRAQLHPIESNLSAGHAARPARIPFAMILHSSRACAENAARPRLVERRLARFAPRVQGAVRALAERHPRLADLAVSFPALLFALAVPRRGIDAARLCARVIAGDPLAELAAAADVPLWLRRLPPESFVRPIVTLPDGDRFRRLIANHLPRSPKLAAVWLQAVCAAAHWGHERLAVWIARELVREAKRVKLERLRLISLLAWFSMRPGTIGHGLIDHIWRSDMSFATAQTAADAWRMTLALQLNLGSEPIADMWAQPGSIAGYEFRPLRSIGDIREEARAMRNCLCTYGYNLAHNRSRLWSVRKDGERVATLKIARTSYDPLPVIRELEAAGNTDAPPQVWLAAREWLHRHDLLRMETNGRAWGSVPLDRAAWMSLWRPYWLAKRRIPGWLPLAPSRAALEAL